MNAHPVLSYFVLISIFKCTNALLCYSCNDLKSNKACFNVTACPDGEVCFGRADGFQTAEVKHTTGCTKELVCFSEKVTTFHKTKFRFGCVSEKECDIHPVNSPMILGRRTEGHFCSVCCKTDHCNVNACSHNPAGQVFRLKSMSPGAPCTDSDPALCATIGRCNADACKDPSVVKACPSSCVTCGHVGWNSWQPWSSCTKTCDAGTKTRSRVCSRRFSLVGSQSCVGPSFETIDCVLKHCPVNGRWCYETRHDCRDQNTYNSGKQHVCTDSRVKTTCDCPAAKYGGICFD